MNEQKKSWREVYEAHPAADLFPLLPEDELRKLGEDILANGLKELIALWLSPEESPVILDGRNRLDAMELVGMETVKPIGDKYRLSVGVRYLSREKNIHFPDSGGVNPFAYTISKNVHRRHMTKAEQADLILKVLKLEKENELLTMRRSFSPEPGERGGSTKEPLKEKFVEAAENQGISKATAQRTWDKDRGPVQQHKAHESKADLIRTDIPNLVVDRVARESIAYLEHKFQTLKRSGIAEVLTAIVDHFQALHGQGFDLLERRGPL